MNRLAIDIKVFTEGQEYKAEGIIFTDTAIVKICIDHRDIHDDADFIDALIYFPELLRSAEGTGKYLIFTCACGIADDGGWNYVGVNHIDDAIEWRININNRELVYSFDKHMYHSEILEAKKRIERLNSKITLEPQDVVYPEE